MKISRRNLLLAVLGVSIAAWGLLRLQEKPVPVAAQTVPVAFSPVPNFSLIEEGLYQGGQVREPPAGTIAVLNLCETKDVFQCEIHCHEAIPDSAPAPTLSWLRKRVEFVDEQRRAGRVTYVHCAAGISRAGMVVTAYEMYKNGWTRDEALKYVRTKRPATRPNPAFMALLKEWEEELKVHPNEKGSKSR